jgi:hypothetical protein
MKEVDVKGSISIYEPPAAAIDWYLFRECIRTQWHRQVDMIKDLHLRQGGVADSMYHGKPISLLPFLRACKAMGKNPIMFLMER